MIGKQNMDMANIAIKAGTSFGINPMSAIIKMVR